MIYFMNKVWDPGPLVDGPPEPLWVYWETEGAPDPSGTYYPDPYGRGFGACTFYRVSGTRFVDSGGASIRTSSIVVGNAPAGDTASMCDYLDTGNGAQLAAAIAAAAAGPKDVYVRPGTYDLGAAGAPADPLTVPAGVRVKGAGRKLTRIQTDADGGQGGAFYLHGVGAALEDLRVFCPAPTAPQTGSAYGIIEIDANDCELRRVEVEFDNYWLAATPSDVQIDCGVYTYFVSPVETLTLSDFRLLKVPRLHDAPGGHYVYGLYLEDINRVEIRDLEIDGADYGINKTDVLWMNVIGFRLTNFDYFGFISYDNEGVNFSDGYLLSGSVSSVGLCFTNTKGFTLSNTYFTGDGHVAIWIGGDARRGLVCGCHGGGGWDEGVGAAFVFIDSWANGNVVTGCHANGDEYVDWTTGTPGNEFAHNF